GNGTGTGGGRRGRAGYRRGIRGAHARNRARARPGRLREIDAGQAPQRHLPLRAGTPGPADRLAEASGGGGRQQAPAPRRLGGPCRHRVRTRHHHPARQRHGLAGVRRRTDRRPADRDGQRGTRCRGRGGRRSAHRGPAGHGRRHLGL
ncbi:MAG: YbaK/prolyl-tRNA synthetase associated region, partial [uncultured Arthrobacter sp.]